MLDVLLVPLGYAFFLRALFVGGAIALVAALVGTHLTHKGFSMIGDGLSHVGFGAIAVSAAVGAAPLAVAIPVVVVAAFLLLRLASKSGEKADAQIAMLSTAALAVGVVAVSLAGTNFDLNSYLFGSVLAVSEADAPLMLGLCALIFLLYLLFYPAFFSLTFDEEFFAVKVPRASLFRSLLAALSAVIVVIGMQSVGALLISALLIFPPSAAARLARSFRAAVCLSGVFSLFSLFSGLYLSYYLALPAGAAVVLANAVTYLLVRLIASCFSRRA